MARTRKSHKKDEEEVKSSKSKLKPAYGSTGHNPFVVYADLQREADPYARVLVLNFAAEYSAKAFIDALIHNDEWEWVDPVGSRKCIRTTGGVRISMFKDDLEMLLKYKPTEAEKEWTDEEMKQKVLRFKYGVHEEAKRDDYEEPEDGTDETLGDNRKAKKRSKRKEPREPKTPKVKVDKSGYISANEIAAELKLEGREVRGILRAKLQKPDIGWAWEKGSAELKQARKVIEDGVKALNKKKGKKK